MLPVIDNPRVFDGSAQEAIKLKGGCDLIKSTSERHGEKYSKSFHISLLGAALFVAFLSWAVSSPVASSPDDDFHLGSIWCADSFKNDKCTLSGIMELDGKTLVEIVPVGLPCFAGNPAVTGACQKEFYKLPAQLAFMNTGLYPNGFYEVMNFFVGKQSAESVIAMRVFNSLIFVFLFSLALAISTQKTKLTLALTFILTSVPLAMFLIPSTNPSGWLYTAITLNWAFLIVILNPEVKGPKVAIGAFGFLITGFMALESRHDGKYFLAVSIFVTYLLLNKSSRTNRTWLHILPISLIFIGIWKYFHAPKFGGFGLPGSAESLDQIHLLRISVMRAIEIPLGNLGFNLGGGSLGIMGALDTPVPNLVPIITIGLLAAWLFLLTDVKGLLETISTICIYSLLVVLPSYYLYLGSNTVGENVQPRYVLGLLPLLIVTSLGFNRPMATTKYSLPTRFIVTAWVLFIANGLSLLSNLERYVSGINSSTFPNLFSDIDWWWPISISPLLVWIFGSLAYLVFLLTLFQFLKHEKTYNPLEN
jgi:hypothetical protein